MALTDTLIRQLKPKNKAYSMNDIDGLSLFIAANGRKSWHFRFSWQSKQSRISFGTYPEITLKDARRLKEEARSQIAKGIDPRNQRPQFIDNNIIVVQEKQCMTFAEFSDVWKQFKLKKLGIEKSERRQSTKIQIERYLHKDMLPILGELPLDKIAREHVLLVQRKIEKRGALSIAEKCRSWLNEMFRVAVIKNASRVIAVHNHPSGRLVPSDADKDITDRLIQVGRILNIEIVDHLIISPLAYISFRGEGLMAELEKSLNYVPSYQIVKQIRQEEKAIAKEALKIERDAKKAMEQDRENILTSSINFLVEKEIPVKQIAEILGVSVREVNRIIKNI